MTSPESDFDERLLSPDWATVESHFKCTIPSVLKNYYADPTKILEEPFNLETPTSVEGENSIHIEFFSPIDRNSIEHFEGFERFLEIASDGGEGLYFIDPLETDPEVYLFVMDGYDLYPTGLRLTSFLTSPRLYDKEIECEELAPILSPWPFSESPSTAVWTTIGVMRGGEPILRVLKDPKDRLWRFLSGEDSCAMIVFLREIVALDPSITSLFDLTMGQEAVRHDVNSSWTRTHCK